MKRFLAALTCLALASAATANIMPREPKLWMPERLQKEEKKKPEFIITDKTEIKLDGKRCELKDVPKDAIVVLLEVNSKNEVLRIHFESKK